MKLEHIQIRKLLAHNVAMYHPTVKPMSEVEVVTRRTASLDAWEKLGSWAEWCGDGSTRERSKPVKMRLRASQIKRFSDWKKKNKTTKTIGKAVKVMKIAMKTSTFRRAKHHWKLRR